MLFCIGGFAHPMLSGALITPRFDMFDSRTVDTASEMAENLGLGWWDVVHVLIEQSADA